MEWTKVGADRKIISSGNTQNLPSVEPGQFLIVGVRGDSSTQRATQDYGALEGKPELPVSVSTTTVGVGEAVTLQSGVPFSVLSNEGEEGVIDPVGTVSFVEEGTYRIRFVPVDPDSIFSRSEAEVTVTSGGTPVTTDITVGERSVTLLDAARDKLARFDLAVSRAQQRVQDADAVNSQADNMSNMTHVIAATKELSRIQSETNSDLASALSHVRRGFQALLGLAERQRR